MTWKHRIPTNVQVMSLLPQLILNGKNIEKIENKGFFEKVAICKSGCKLMPSAHKQHLSTLHLKQFCDMQVCYLDRQPDSRD